MYPGSAVVAGPDSGLFVFDWELKYWGVGWSAQWVAVPHVEARAVQWALNAAGGWVKVARRQGVIFVAAAVSQCVEFAIKVEHDDRGAGDVVTDGFHLAGQQFGARAYESPSFAHVWFPIDFSTAFI
ncbi:hypothetical protein AB672_08120 [Xylella taiwanensis]|nr:hypothetical protein AB672_08120 [Xylella taiwanensis]